MLPRRSEFVEKGNELAFEQEMHSLAKSERARSCIVGDALDSRGTTPSRSLCKFDLIWQD
jgi:hypothetical protein